MVRLKHRYLLVNILYPPSPSDACPATKADGASQKELDPETRFHLQLCQPTPDTLTAAVLIKMLRETVSEMFGDWGMGRLGGAGAGGISVKYLSPATSTAIIRCPRDGYRLVWAALTYMSCLPNPQDQKGVSRSSSSKNQQHDCVFRVVRVSGSMKCIETEAIRRARMELVRLSGRSEKEGKDLLQDMFPGGAAKDTSMGIGIESDDEADEEEDDG
ncbi:RNA-binding protein pop5 [Ophidiomyces ophidiicola]|nr:RNA-binding protein pop5 [Ophidiomyces ophidiicola]KAI1957958.1 RNA-binding protein pop5 [Ophidiomyces ophidiicola]